MNNDQYNNQNNLTDNAPIASPGTEDMKKQLTFTEAPAVAEPLPTAVTNKNMTKDRTIMLTVFFVIVSFVTIAPVLSKHFAAAFLVWHML